MNNDYVSAEAMIKSPEVELSGECKAVVSDLTRWIGGPDMLEQARELVSNNVSKAALDHLREVYKIAETKGFANHVLYDLSMTGHLDYYTGVIFRGYAKGSGYAVVNGGRYDNLLAEFGRPSPAVGFAVRLDSVLEALGRG
jgi:ATP phosphoribosyltransferase regulatory subunit